MTGQPGKAQMISRDLRHARECRRAASLAQSPANRAVGADPAPELPPSLAACCWVTAGFGWRLRLRGFTLLLEPAAASGLTLRLYGARPCTG